MATEGFSSRQDLTLEENDSGKPKSKKAWNVSYPLAAFLLVLALGIIVGVGLLVWFLAPREKCSVELFKDEKYACYKYMKVHGKESICGAPPKVARQQEEPMTGFRLNLTLLPYHYDIELWPRLYDGDDFSFNGSVTIFMTCAEETDVIVLHVDNVTVHKESIYLRDESFPSRSLGYASLEEDVPRQFYKIFTQSPLRVNRNYTITMTFNGTLIHPDWRGFYRSSYKENNKLHWLVSTQFQRTHARRAFPCFDEPALKATFNTTLVRRFDYRSISNMPIAESVDRGGGWVADVYEKTVVMPTYLLAFVVSQFEFVESVSQSGVKLRVWTRPSFIQYASYANSISGDVLAAFEQWTGVPYSLPKMDQVAVPDFRAGAMENWGLLTYRETALLVNPNYTDMADKRWVASVIAHEIAHQWFGNLITCHWWDDTFLNEGFATYFGDMVGVHNVETNWNMDEFFLRRVQYIMNIDGAASSQPVYVPDLEHHDDLLKAFHRITYYKGAALLRMMKYFLTERTFRLGMQNYLRRHAFGTVTHEDLYRALQEQAQLDDTVTWDVSRTNLSGILDTWVEQMNFPLVHVTDLKSGQIKVKQSHFLYDHEQNVTYPTPIGDQFIWDIPLTYGGRNELSRKAPKLKWLHRDQEVIIPEVASEPWILFNFNQQGFYRVKYDNVTWDALVKQLLDDHTVIPVENRAALIDDAQRLALAGEMDEVEALRSTEYLKAETEYLPYAVYRSRMNYYLNMFYGRPAYDDLLIYMRNLVIPMYNRTGWVVSDPDNLLERQTRVIVIAQACFRAYKPCEDQARHLYEEFMTNPSVNPIPPDLRFTVYCTGVAKGGIREWNFLLSRLHHDYGDVYIAYENSTVLNALSCPRQSHVIRRYLDYALEKNSTSMFTEMVGYRAAKDTAWNYITEHWDDFGEGNSTRISKDSILYAVTNNWNTKSDMAKLEYFRNSHNDPKLDSTYDKIKKTIQKNIDWLEANLEHIQMWLQRVNSGERPDGNAPRRRKRSPVRMDDTMDYDIEEKMLRASIAV